MDSKIFTTGVFDGGLWGRGKCFLTAYLCYFITVIIQTLHTSSFILVYVDILHIVNVVMLRFVFPSPEKLHFGH